MGSDDTGARPFSLPDASGILQHRLLVERQLAAAEERFRITLASIGDGVISTDVDGRVTFLNPVAEELTEWSLADAVGRELAEIFPIVDETTRETVGNPALQALRENDIVALEDHTLLITRSGRERPIDDSAAPIRDETGTVLGSVLVFRDVSERKRAEELQVRLAAIVESSDDAIISKTIEGIITTWNPGAERLFKYSASEAIGEPITLIIPPERIDEERAILLRLSRRERIQHYETIRVDRFGRRLDISLSVCPLVDSSGRVIGAAKVARDISEKRITIEALRRSERRHRLLAEVGQAVQVYSTGEEITGAAARLLVEHLEVERCAYVETRSSGRLVIIGAAARGVLSEERVESVATDSTSRVLAMGHNEPFVVADVEDDTRITPEELEACSDAGIKAVMWVPLHRDGGLTAAMAIYHTAPRPWSIDEIELVQIVADRCWEALERAKVSLDLRASESQLKEADRKKDEFIALLAHELRNPLAPIRNGLEVLRLADDPRVRDDALDMMGRQLTHMVRLVDDLLDVARIARNKLELRRSHIQLADVVRNAVEASQPLFTQRGHKLEIALPHRPVLLDADSTRLSQVVANLLTNSAKYTERGGRIRLTGAIDGDQVEISVHDTGSGISRDDLPNIFAMFAQVDRTDDRSSGGLGIGLALVKALVEMHDGTVTAESAGLGHGSTFKVRLQTIAEPDAPAEPAPSDTTDPALRRRVLVVDDNVDAANSMSMMLRLLGHEARTAHDGLQAIEVTREFQPDVILMDLGMPRLNGYEAARQIREFDSNVRIVALTGWGQEPQRERSRTAGCDGHLIKPIDLAALRRILQE
jgi:PAS domain S-box-containing protein